MSNFKLKQMGALLTFQHFKIFLSLKLKTMVMKKNIAYFKNLKIKVFYNISYTFDNKNISTKVEDSLFLKNENVFLSFEIN